ncbi:extracellular solute-binding protein [Lapillicoccus jejuensis]|uniref:Putative spermidine/putrescine transport system substrate-binding protein n=1 Tax=Lapillicoccus jejuensis TaxID=402171 RepID=A0A542E1I3_9MICO|nr:extracellular solute-binding protein [Lapillicoccus jejuensis]TQJ09211.1 putative spermidine/putrescine transport system substrate-binding protein [Lapillicoccus jejuensis]
MSIRTSGSVLLGAALAATALTACGSTSGSSGSSGGDKTITVAASGDTNVQQLWQQLLIPDFEKANPGTTVKLSFDLHGNNDQQNFARLAAATQQKKDPGVDLVASFTDKAASAGLLADVSSQVTNLKDVDPQIVKAGGAGAIPYRASSVLLAYNPSTVMDPPKTLADLLTWIKAHPGKFTYNSPKSGGSGQAFVVTVLDSQTPQADREKMTSGYDKSLEKDWDAGWSTLSGLNQYVYQKGVYPNGNNQVLQLLSSGQIDMAPVWSDQFISGQAAGTIPKTVKAQQITNPSFTGGAAYVGVTKASKNQELAAELANFILTPDEQAKIADKIAGYPVIPISKLSSEVQQKFSGADANNLRPGLSPDHASDVNDLWDQKVPGK